jgi:hypothetical protein
MANPVMNYNQFMSVFKKAAYSGKANLANKDAGSNSKINQGLVRDHIKGSGTPTLNKYTKQHLANIKKKSAAGK